LASHHYHLTPDITEQEAWNQSGCCGEEKSLLALHINNSLVIELAV